MTKNLDPTLTHNQAQHRYEAWVGEQLAGYAQYQQQPEHIAFTHTVVQPQYEGQGVGSALVRYALDDVRGAGEHQVKPVCPFVAAWIARHPDYQSLLADNATP